MEKTSPPPASLPPQLVATGNTDKNGSATSSSSSSVSLHTVRKRSAKPWKKPTAPPTPPKVYRVDPHGFRPLVQRLTGAPLEMGCRRLQAASPEPLVLVPRLGAPPPPPLQPPATELGGWGDGVSFSSWTAPDYAGSFLAGKVTIATEAENVGRQAQPNMASTLASSSPYSEYLTWCNLHRLSPRSMECLEQSTFL